MKLLSGNPDGFSFREKVLQKEQQINDLLLKNWKKQRSTRKIDRQKVHILAARGLSAT
jgi:hypothetical protein